MFALDRALELNRADMVSLLLSVCQADKFPVLEAINIGYTGNFQAFLWNGWDINEPVRLDGPSALGFAVDNAILVTWLLDHGADPNAGFEYDTPLSRAAVYGSIEVLQTLLSHGGNVQRGQVLHYAIERDDQCHEVISILPQRGAPVNQLEYDGVPPIWSVLWTVKTPLHKAVERNKIDIVAKLLEYGADPDTGDTSGKTARVLAAELQRNEITSLMDREQQM